MPNHCANQLTIYGEKSNREDFLKEMIVWTIGSTIVSPEEKGAQPILELRKIIECDYNYNDPIHLWGTKWGCYDLEIQETEQHTIIQFMTAWCPYNHEVQKKMSRKFPELSFELLYAERGVSFCGFYKSKKEIFIFHQEECMTQDICKECGKECGSEEECPDCEGEVVEILCPIQKQYQELYEKSG